MQSARYEVTLVTLQNGEMVWQIGYKVNNYTANTVPQTSILTPNPLLTMPEFLLAHYKMHVLGLIKRSISQAAAGSVAAEELPFEKGSIKADREGDAGSGNASWTTGDERGHCPRSETAGGEGKGDLSCCYR